MRSTLLAVVTCCVVGCGGAAEVPATPSNQRTVPVESIPDLASLRALLRPHDRHRFAENATNDRGCPRDQDLGAYIAMLEANAANHTLTGGCGPFPEHLTGIDPPVDDAFWFCRIDGYTMEGGEPWHYELRIRIAKSDREPDWNTVACPGTP